MESASRGWWCRGIARLLLTREREWSIECGKVYPRRSELLEGWASFGRITAESLEPLIQHYGRESLFEFGLGFLRSDIIYIDLLQLRILWSQVSKKVFHNPVLSLQPRDARSLQPHSHHLAAFSLDPENPLHSGGFNTRSVQQLLLPPNLFPRHTKMRSSLEMSIISSMNPTTKSINVKLHLVLPAQVGIPDDTSHSPDPEWS